MHRYVVLSFMITISNHMTTAPPVRLTIDCGSDETDEFLGYQKSRSTSDFDVSSFCSMIQKAIPKAVKDGRFIQVDEDHDQAGLGNALVPLSVAPPNGFIPKFPKLKSPKLKIPKLNVPILATPDRSFAAPRVGSSKPFSSFREVDDEESSAEKMEKFKKGVQKMLHVVKVLGQIDQYLSERTRIIIEKLSKTFAE